MNELFDSVGFWIALVVIAGIGIYAINAFLGRLADARSNQNADKSPHRVANELPRELHTKDGTEVVELKDQKEIEGK